MSVVGLEVPHAHVHLIPIDGVHDMNFGRPKLKPSPEELAAIAERLLVIETIERTELEQLAKTAPEAAWGARAQA